MRALRLLPETPFRCFYWRKTMEACQEEPQGLGFGRFRIFPREGRLLAGDEPVPLGSRAFDLLLALAEANGTIVRKDVLISRVWQKQFVSENNLQAQVTALRKALGPDRDLIRTISGRGYQFTGRAFPLSVAASLDLPRPGAAVEWPVQAPSSLPKPNSELIGREADLADILGLFSAHRLVTLTGIGGVGKTRLACEAAARLSPEFPDGLLFVDLSPVTDPDLVPGAVASAAGIDIAAGEMSVEQVAAAIGAKKLMLVLDTCEHVIDAAAAMAATALRHGAGVRILATSREPLQVEGEWVYRLRPLLVPVVDEPDLVFDRPASALFVARLRATSADVPTDHNGAAAIAAICRRLDGLPLAIEMAATRAATLGVHTVAGCLDDRLHLLTCGRRTALPRHQSLRAMLDWSWALLTPLERKVLRRLSAFGGVFGLQAAEAAARSEGIGAGDATDGLASLVSKSLVSAELERGAGCYRLLETTRAYAFEKLADAAN
jgi:predicted ATPase/DNA-binding winged helix-turn-helix (wHTH) protein